MTQYKLVRKIWGTVMVESEHGDYVRTREALLWERKYSTALQRNLKLLKKLKKLKKTSSPEVAVELQEKDAIIQTQQEELQQCRVLLQSSLNHLIEVNGQVDAVRREHDQLIAEVNDPTLNGMNPLQMLILSKIGNIDIEDGDQVRTAILSLQESLTEVLLMTEKPLNGPDISMDGQGHFTNPQDIQNPEI